MGMLQPKPGLYGSYLPIDVMHRDMHKDGSLSQPLQVNMSVACCLKTKEKASDSLMSHRRITSVIRPMGASSFPKKTASQAH